MKPIPATPETEALARRIIRFEDPAKALSDPIRFLANALEGASFEDMCTLLTFIDNDDIRQVLSDPPPGIIRPRSWAYWHARLGRYPPPPLPARRFG